MGEIIPKQRPKLNREAATVLVKHFGLEKEPLVLGAIRGYYQKSFGDPEANDRGVYDDCGFLWTPEMGELWIAGGKVPPGFPTNGSVVAPWYETFNFNCDPSKTRPGHGFGEKKGIASVQPGVYRDLRVDLHKGRYEALCQRLGPVKVWRDGPNGSRYEQTSAWVGANVHEGGLTGTWSEGCWTIPSPQYPLFMSIVKAVLRKTYGFEKFMHNGKYIDLNIPRFLITEQQRRDLL